MSDIRRRVTGYAFSATLVLALAGLGCAPEPTERIAAPIRIGMYAGISGPTGAWGQNAKEGAVLAVETINRDGGVLGRSLELLIEDDQGKPEESAAVVTKLISRDGVVAIIGGDTSSRSLAAAPICQVNRIPMISPTATLPDVTRKGNYIFRVCTTDSYEARAIARFAGATLKVSRVAVMRDMKNDYSVGVTQIFTEAYEKLGGSVIAVHDYAEADSDFRGQLTTIKAARPEAILIPGYYGDIAQIAIQARELGISVPMFGGSGWNSPKLVEIAGSNVEGSFFLGFPPPRNQSFIDAFRKRYGKEPDASNALAYDAVALIASAISRAGATGGNAIRNALAATTGFEGMSGTITVGADRDPIKEIGVYVIEKGRFVVRETIKP